MYVNTKLCGQYLYLLNSLPLSANRILYIGQSISGSIVECIKSLETIVGGDGHLQLITVRPFGLVILTN